MSEPPGSPCRGKHRCTRATWLDRIHADWPRVRGNARLMYTARLGGRSHGRRVAADVAGYGNNRRCTPICPKSTAPQVRSENCGHVQRQSVLPKPCGVVDLERQRYFQQRKSQSCPVLFQSASTALEAKATCATPCSSPGSFV